MERSATYGWGTWFLLGVAKFVVAGALGGLVFGWWRQTRGAKRV